MPRKKHRKRARQVAALAFRRTEDGGILVLLMSSRDTARPVVPKGWPMAGRSDAKAAAREAFEEAGVRGRVAKKPIGSYTYWKRLTDSFRLVRVDVFPLEVRKTARHFPEEGVRRFAWLPKEEAAEVVDDPELATLIRDAQL